MAGIEPEELKIWLEWSGGKLLSLRLPSAGPQGYRNYWPDIAPDRGSYGYTAETLRPPTVAPHEVRIMDLIQELPTLIADLRTRRIVRKRSLIAPLTGHYVNSYVKIAAEEHIDARLAARLYLKGLDEICRRVSFAQINTIRKSMS